MEKELIYFCTHSYGGIKTQSINQVIALSKLGVKIHFICPKDWNGYILKKPSKMIYGLIPKKSEKIKNKFFNKIFIAFKILYDHYFLFRYIGRSKINYVIFGSFSEILAPIWVPFFKLKIRNNVKFAVVPLDPIRDRIIGPNKWLHYKLVDLAYSIFSEIYLHSKVNLPINKTSLKQRINIIEHGPLIYPEYPNGRAETRKQLGLKDEDKILLSFGFIRDSKNINLIIEALTYFDNLHLLIVGSEAPKGQIQSSEYKILAQKLGLQNRVHWFVEFVEDFKVRKFFDASDYVICAYWKNFVSESGLPNITAPLKKPILVSCGDSALGDKVEKYSLGYRVGPDSTEEIVKGINYLLKDNLIGKWDKYLEDCTFKKNAEVVINSLFDNQDSRN